MTTTSRFSHEPYDVQIARAHEPGGLFRWERRRQREWPDDEPIPYQLTDEGERAADAARSDR